MMNFSIGIYPYFSYTPSTYLAAFFAGLVYLSLILWFVKSLRSSCRPRIIAVLIFLSHFLTFSELVLRATLTLEERNTKTLYRVTASFISTSSQLLLASNFQCLIEMRGKIKRRPIDIVSGILVPIGLIGAAVLLSIGKNFSFIPERWLISFRLRQISVGIILLYIILFFVFWHYNVINVYRRFIKPLLIITSICLFVDAIYVLATSIPSLFSPLNENELWFYLGHLLPAFIALLSWSILYWRKSPTDFDKSNENGEQNKEKLLSNSET